jgi:hypothetical protein
MLAAGVRIDDVGVDLGYGKDRFGLYFFDDHFVIICANVPGGTLRGGFEGQRFY